MLNITSTDAIGMAIAAIALISLSVWAQGFRKRTRDLIGSRNIFFAFSGILLIVSVGAMVFKGFNLGMDFAGGTIVEVGFADKQETVTPEIVRNAIKAYSDEKHLDFLEAQVQVQEKAMGSAADFRRVIIRLGRADKRSITTDEIEGMVLALDTKVGHLYRQVGKGLTGAPPAPGLSAAPSPAKPGEKAPSATASSAPKAKPSTAPAVAKSAPVATASGAPAASPSPSAAQAQAASTPADISNAILSRETIDPIIGSELWTNSLMALVVALILQLLYITLRFGNQVRYGLAADIALVHDVVIMAGLYSLTSRQVDSPFLAALLTVIGYSVMDSIVVFDRIRENVRHARKGNYAEICNASVNQTMSRSVNTTLTVLLTLFALYFFGGDTLRNFAFALLVGITCGAYSSIFIATPLVVIFDGWVKKREEERVAERRRQRDAAASATPQPGLVSGAASRDESPRRRSGEEPGTPLRRRSTDAPVTEEDSGDDETARRTSGAARRRRTRRKR